MSNLQEGLAPLVRPFFDLELIVELGPPDASTVAFDMWHRFQRGEL